MPALLTQASLLFPPLGLGVRVRVGVIVCVGVIVLDGVTVGVTDTAGVNTVKALQ